jgi:fructosamine-3-kinase
VSPLLAIPADVQQGIARVLSQKHTSGVVLKNFTPTGGGCINHGGKLATSGETVFLKWNHAAKYPGMFRAEARGLKLLHDTHTFHIPEVIGTGEEGLHQFILLEYLEQRNRQENYWEIAGRQLAQLHQFSKDSFGLDHKNYIGALPQINTRENSWIQFFIHQRLNIQLQQALQHGLVDTTIVHKFETLYTQLPGLLPEEKPVLVHGDLWIGNLITTANGAPALIDPAVYYGHREADLAMTQLFGGFAPTFLASYQQAYTLAPGYNDRFQLYNLYPLLVHLNLFGRSYWRQINSVLKRFIS